MISRKNLDDLIEGYTDARNRVSAIGYDLEDLSTLATATSSLFARAGNSIGAEINDLYVHINGALNQLSGIKPED
ncbi:MAG TPA: hypothetical protein VHX38_15225 [Pseudonocardiaceae bacterium]|jgi:hypothetical protein|nr:hypothetical protein [Pseudonocardiaceae bacterium]